MNNYKVHPSNLKDASSPRLPMVKKLSSTVLWATLLLANGRVLAQPAVEFVRDARALYYIRVNGLCATTGGGVYGIASATGSDDSNNFSTEDGDGKTMSNGGPPYSFNFTSLAYNALGFDLKIGPANRAIAVSSLAMDFSKSATSSWAFLGGARYQWVHTAYDSGRWNYGTSNTYESIPAARTWFGGVGLAVPEGKPLWTEIHGTVADVRLVLGNTTGFKQTSFTNHSGTNNLGVDFQTLSKGQSVELNGQIVVTPKADPYIRYECENQPSWVWPVFSHQTGRSEGSGYSVNVLDPAEKYLVFGPYVTGHSGKRKAEFRILIDNNSADNNRILTLDVFDGQKVLASREVKRRDFARAGVYQDFVLSFTVIDPNRELEFRTYYHGGAYINQDAVTLR